MYKILNKKEFSPTIKLMEVEAPAIARKAKPGNFIIFRVDEKGERVPLTIANSDPVKGTITIIFQEVGKSTIQLGKLNVGDSILDFVGPLGHPTHIEKFGRVVCVGGGVGVAPVYPITKGMHQAENEVISIVGARNKDLLFFEEEMRAVSDELHICTDDGSYGHKGFVTELLKQVIEDKKDVDLVVAIGPLPMMKACAEVTRPYGIKTVVSLNSIMVDGTGMCGACRVTVGGETKFACVDGPEFDGHLVDFEEQARRAKIFRTEEQKALAKGSCGGGCGCH